MKREFLLIVCFVIFGSIASAQRIRITGRVTDSSSSETPFQAANVVLRKADSTFVVGASTDMDGRFKLERISGGDYILVISAIGYNNIVTDLRGLEKSIDLGDISIHERMNEIEEVTVTAANIINSADRKIVFPSKSQLVASTDGVNLLQALMLPRVHVDPFNRKIGVAGGGTVQLLINGVKVGNEEVMALRADEVIRIEYIEEPSLRYGNAEIALNYITKRQESGGYIGLDLTNSPHIMFHNDGISAKLNHKKSEFSIYYYASPRDFYDCWRTNRESFLFEDGSTLTRYEDGNPGHLRELNHRGNISYNLQETDKYMFNAKLGYRGYLKPIEKFQGNLYNIEHPEHVTRMIDLMDMSEHSPYLDLYYQHQLKERQLLAFNLVGTYIHTDSKRSYQEIFGEDKMTDIFSGVDGDKYSIIAEAIYEKGFNNGTLSLGVNHTQALSDNHYFGSNIYNSKMKQAETYAYAEFKGKWNRFNYTLGIGASRSWLKQRGMDGYQTYIFHPRFSFRYAFNNNLYARLSGSLRNIPPALSELSAVEQMIDSLRIERGNPNLDPYKCFQSDLYIEYNRDKYSVGLSSTYRTYPNAIMETTILEDGKFVHTYENHHGAKSMNMEINLRASSLFNFLSLSLNGGVNHYRSNGNSYQHKYTNWYYRAEMMARYKGFTTVFSIFNRRNSFWGERMTSGENIHLLSLMYKHKQITVGCGLINPFADNYKRIKESWNRNLSSVQEIYVNESSRAFILTLSWNIKFGRGYKSGSKRISNQDTESGVINGTK